MTLRAVGTVLLVGAVLATACGAHTFCTTRCGMSLAAPSACEPFQEQEDTMLALLDQRHIYPYAPSCAALDDYVVRVEPTADAGRWRSGVNPNGTPRYVAGLTDCYSRTITVGHTRWHSQSNALSHEIVHAVQDCRDGPNGDPHYGWTDAGINAAIEAARPDP